MKYNICVYAIAKNEEQFVDRWVESMSEADEIIVLDTGSKDNTVSKLKFYGVKVYSTPITPWRFDKARNLSLSLTPQDTDIYVCTDLDEVFKKGWRKRLEEGWTPNTTMVNYTYNWSLKPDGSPDVQLTYFKIHNKHYQWKYPVHECLTYIGASPEQKVYIPEITLNHYPDKNKSRSSYLPLLQLGTKEMPKDPRMHYYLGREYLYTEQYENCIETLTTYLDLPTANFIEERGSAMRLIAKSYAKLGKVQESYSWYYSAMALIPHIRESYIDLAQVAYEIGDWATVFNMTNQALAISERSHNFTNEGYAWDHTPDDLAAIACYNLELYTKSLYHAEKALKISPSDNRLQNNYIKIKEKLKEKQE